MGTRYQKVIDFLEHEISLKGESEAERKNLLQAGRLNLALCYLKLGKWIEARAVCGGGTHSLSRPFLSSSDQRRVQQRHHQQEPQSKPLSGCNQQHEQGFDRWYQ